jgi:preprotein translocase subunit SecA
VHNAIHAHALLRRDVDYVVKDRAIESVDQFKGRIAPDRRWPAGLHTALEAKEGLPFRKQGRVLASITLQNLVALYPQACGMTAPRPRRPGVPAFLRNGRRGDSDQPPRDPRRPGRRGLPHQARQGRDCDRRDPRRPRYRPADSGGHRERGGIRAAQRALAGIPHAVLNARNEEEEAGIVARAGERGAVTISTNMAGRGVDIRLGEGVAELGGCT